VPLVSAPPRLAQVAYVQVFEADRFGGVDRARWWYRVVAAEGDR